MEPCYLPEQILTERCIISRHEMALAEAMFAYVDQDRQRLRAFLPWVDTTRTLADEEAYIAFSQAQWQNYKMFDYGIFRRSDNRYMGNIGVHTVVWDHARCELGYWIFGDFEGQGYISEAVKALEAVLFAVGFHRIEIRCVGHNSRSRAVPERNGYQLEGILREHVWEQGSFSDTCIYAKLAAPVLKGP